MKVKFSIAANAQGVTLGQYIDYQNAMDEVERVHIITGKSSESIKLFQLHVLNEVITKFEAALTLGSEGFRRKVRIGATELGFVPDLTELTFGEYVDIDSQCTALYKDGKLNGEAALKMMCILYRPIAAKFGNHYDIEKYDSSKVKKYIDAVRMLTLNDVHNVLLFFSSLEIELYNSSLEYLAKEITEIVTEATKQ
jgi:hypothetical protein